MSLTFEIHLPPKTEAEFDVKWRYLEIQDQVEGNEEPQEEERIEVPVDQLIVGPYLCDHGQMVIVRVWNVNDSQNPSLEPRVLEMIVKDPFHPPTPGEIQIKVTGKTHAPDRGFILKQNDRIDITPENGLLSDVVTVERNDIT